MRIAMMTNNYRPTVGGVPVSIDRLTDALRRRGHEVTIFAPSHPGVPDEPGVVRFGSHKHILENGFVIPSMYDRKIEEYFRVMHYDVIHVHHPMMIGYMALYLSHKFGVPLAFTYHTRYEQYLHYVKLYSKLQQTGEGDNGLCRSARKAVTKHNRAFTNACDLVFAPTPLMQEFLLENGTIRPIVVMPTGLGDEDFAAEPQTAATIRALYAGGRKHLFCIVSRLEKEKNMPFLLDALAAYKAAHGDCFRMLFIGEGTEREALEEQAARLGLRDNVVFLGCIPHERLASYYRACDLFLFASHSETQGIVLLEAMAAGLPVVAVEASGVCDVVVNGRNGWMTEEDTPQFISHMHRVLADSAALQSLRKGALRTALSCTADEMAATAEENYEWMIVERRLQSNVDMQPVAGLRVPVGAGGSSAYDAPYDS